MKRLLCLFGIHNEAMEYVPGLLSVVAVCLRCGRVRVVDLENYRLRMALDESAK